MIPIQIGNTSRNIILMFTKINIEAGPHYHFINHISGLVKCTGALSLELILLATK